MDPERVTHGIRVTVRPTFLPSQSRPRDGRFLFLYDVEIENVGERTGTLLRRHWRIHEDGGEDSEVRGDGVIGQQPTLAPGDVHHYQSFCVLATPSGFMEGTYTFERPGGELFDVEIPRFLLRAAWPGPGAGVMH
ncbi:MAG: Co2+/Mg2+ efflux protein ApaG [Gemmatimonadota bacterium]